MKIRCLPCCLARTLLLLHSLRSRLKRGIRADIVERIFLLRLSFDVLVFEPRWGSDASHLKIYTLSLLRRQTAEEFC
jgi:hypothetical protein